MFCISIMHEIKIHITFIRTKNFNATTLCILISMPCQGSIHHILFLTLFLHISNKKYGMKYFNTKKFMSTIVINMRRNLTLALGMNVSKKTLKKTKRNNI